MFKLHKHRFTTRQLKKIWFEVKWNDSNDHQLIVHNNKDISEPDDNT